MKRTIEDICEFFHLEGIFDDDNVWRLHGSEHLVDQVEIPEEWVENTSLKKYIPSSILENPRHSKTVKEINDFFGSFGTHPGIKDTWYFTWMQGNEFKYEIPCIEIPSWPAADVVNSSNNFS